jgi:hypothetical protein
VRPRCDDERVVSRRARAALAGALALLVLLLSGCGGAEDADVEAVAERFYQAVGSGDGATACAVMASRTRDQIEQAAGKSCQDAILDEDLPQPGASDQVSTFGTAAQVRYADETTFLTRFRTGWRVVAAGCAPVPGDRYDCQVAGD